MPSPHTWKYGICLSMFVIRHAIAALKRAHLKRLSSSQQPAAATTAKFALFTLQSIYDPTHSHSGAHSLRFIMSFFLFTSVAIKWSESAWKRATFTLFWFPRILWNLMVEGWAQFSATQNSFSNSSCGQQHQLKIRNDNLEAKWLANRESIQIN